MYKVAHGGLSFATGHVVTHNTSGVDLHNIRMIRDADFRPDDFASDTDSTLPLPAAGSHVNHVVDIFTPGCLGAFVWPAQSHAKRTFGWPAWCNPPSPPAPVLLVFL